MPRARLSSNFNLLGGYLVARAGFMSTVINFKCVSLKFPTISLLPGSQNNDSLKIDGDLTDFSVVLQSVRDPSLNLRPPVALF